MDMNNFIGKMIIAIGQTIGYPVHAEGYMGRISEPIFPIFQHSSIPIGA